MALATTVACYGVIGILWTLLILNRTGYRKRDILLLLVPVVNMVVSIRSPWRYTAKSVYWEPRSDRPSDILRGWQRPAAIAAGYVLFFPFMAVLGAVLSGFEDRGWSDANRRGPGRIVGRLVMH